MQIVLQVQIEIKLSGLILKIEDSKIKTIAAGSVTGTGEIKVEQAHVLRRAFGTIALPSKVNRGNGIPLALDEMHGPANPSTRQVAAFQKAV